MIAESLRLLDDIRDGRSLAARETAACRMGLSDALKALDEAEQIVRRFHNAQIGGNDQASAA